MMARRQERLPRQTRLSGLGRWASALALVAGLSGVNVAAAQPGSDGNAIGAADGTLMLVQSGGAAEELRTGLSSWESLRAIQTAGQAGFYEDAEADNEEEEEGQEDGLLPGGQAEQRSQALGDKAEGRDEDHENSGGD